MADATLKEIVQDTSLVMAPAPHKLFNSATTVQHTVQFHKALTTMYFILKQMIPSQYYNTVQKITLLPSTFAEKKILNGGPL
jgi:hypothetical protein